MRIWSGRFRRLRRLTSGSAALPASRAERLRAIAGVLPLERYGMTEIGMALSNPLDPDGRRPGRVGMPLPTVEAKIVAEVLKKYGAYGYDTGCCNTIVFTNDSYGGPVWTSGDEAALSGINLSDFDVVAAP